MAANDSNGHQLKNTTLRFFLLCVILLASALQLYPNLATNLPPCGIDSAFDADAPVLPVLPSAGSNETITVKTEEIRSTESLVAFFVLSRREGVQQRQAIRDTWAKGFDNIYFVVAEDCWVHPIHRDVDEGGNPLCRVAPRVLDPKQFAKDQRDHILNIQTKKKDFFEEMSTYQDILYIRDGTYDVYRSLPQKVKSAYKFVAERLPSVQWIVKVDDDFFVRPKEFIDSLPPPTDSTLISGMIRTQNKAHVGGKWKEVPQYERNGLYPPFPLGSYGHVVSRDIAEFVATHQYELFDYQGEDTSLGVWLEHVYPKKVDFQTTRHMTNDGTCMNRANYVVGHDFTPQKLQRCYAFFQKT